MSRKLDLSALAAKAESGNNSSVKRIETLNMNIDDLLLEEPFRSLFPIREEIKEAIKGHMQEHGYDESKPIDVWKRATQDGFEYVLVDGFTRIRAAREIGRLTVTAYLHSFASMEEARDYAIHTQRDRRNLSDAEIMSVLNVIDTKMTGFKRSLPLASSDASAEPPAKTAERTAKEIGTSTRKIEKARKVNSDPEITAAVKRGELSINKGYNIIQTREKESAAPSLDREERMVDSKTEEAKDEHDHTVSDLIDLNRLAGRLRTTLGVEVSLSLGQNGKSGHVELRFSSPGQLKEVVERICGLSCPDNTD